MPISHMLYIYMIKQLTLPFLLFFSAVSLLDLPINVNENYELSYPLHFLYYRLNTKLQINPILAHFSHLTDSSKLTACSSRTGPFCEHLNDKYFQQFSISPKTLSQKEKLAYEIEKRNLGYRQKLIRGIETGEIQNIFLVASEDYKALDKLIMEQLKGMIYSRDGASLEKKKEQKVERKGAIDEELDQYLS